MSDADDMEKRRAARAQWPVWVGKLEDMPAEPDLSLVTTAEQRLNILQELSARSWRLTGWPMPSYERSAAPTRIRRAGEP